MPPRPTTSDNLPDFLRSPDLGDLVALALKEMAAQQNGDHPASPVLRRAYTRAADQVEAFHRGDPE